MRISHVARDACRRGASMSNDLAIATVSATLRLLIVDAVSPLGASVSNERPGDGASGPPEPRVNLYLHQVLPNPHYRNSDLPTRSAQGVVVCPPSYAADLRYLITFYGDNAKLTPQLLMARTLIALHSCAIFTPDLIRAAIAAETAVDLRKSDLAAQEAYVRLRPTPLNYDELYRLWSVFTQTPYSLSTHYEAGPVLLDQPVTPVTPVEVRAPRVVVSQYAAIVITEATLSVLSKSPTEKATLRLEGEGFKAGQTARFFAPWGNLNLTLGADEVFQGRAVVLSQDQTDGLHMGVMTVQIIQRIGDDATLVGAQSNVVAFAVSPRILTLTQSGTRLVLTMGRAVAPGQAVSLRLRHEGDDRSYVLPLSTPPDAPTKTLAFDIAGGDPVTPGTYLAFLNVDGASSTLDSPVHRIAIVSDEGSRKGGGQ